VPWANTPQIVYHGTDEIGAHDILRTSINLAVCRPYADFGKGFYVTSSAHQAQQRANVKALRAEPLPGGATRRAAVLSYEFDRDIAGDLNDHLAFVLPNTEFFEFVDYNRLGNLTHARAGGIPYDLVYGPVAAYPQSLTYSNCDQICFLTHPALAALTPLSSAPAYGSPIFL
jgi:hypothetical protein